MNNSHTLIFCFVILYLITPIFAFFASRRKGRNYYLWTLLTLIINPVILILECLPNINFNQVCIVPCRACKQEISYAASACPHCGQPQRNRAYELTSFDRFSILCETVICFFQSIIFICSIFIYFYLYLFYSLFTKIIGYFF